MRTRAYLPLPLHWEPPRYRPPTACTRHFSFSIKSYNEFFAPPRLSVQAHDHWCFQESRPIDRQSLALILVVRKLWYYSNYTLKLTNTQTNQDLGCFKSQKTNQRKKRERMRDRTHRFARFDNCLLLGSRTNSMINGENRQSLSTNTTTFSPKKDYVLTL